MNTVVSYPPRNKLSIYSWKKNLLFGCFYSDCWRKNKLPRFSVFRGSAIKLVPLQITGLSQGWKLQFRTSHWNVCPSPSFQGPCPRVKGCACSRDEETHLMDRRPNIHWHLICKCSSIQPLPHRHTRPFTGFHSPSAGILPGEHLFFANILIGILHWSRAHASAQLASITWWSLLLIIPAVNESADSSLTNTPHKKTKTKIKQKKKKKKRKKTSANRVHGSFSLRLSSAIALRCKCHWLSGISKLFAAQWAFQSTSNMFFCLIIIC